MTGWIISAWKADLVASNRQAMIFDPTVLQEVVGVFSTEPKRKSGQTKR
jgi:hypothetical protein